MTVTPRSCYGHASEAIVTEFSRQSARQVGGSQLDLTRAFRRAGRRCRSHFRRLAK